MPVTNSRFNSPGGENVLGGEGNCLRGTVRGEYIRRKCQWEKCPARRRLEQSKKSVHDVKAYTSRRVFGGLVIKSQTYANPTYKHGSSTESDWSRSGIRMSTWTTLSSHRL